MHLITNLWGRKSMKQGRPKRAENFSKDNLKKALKLRGYTQAELCDQIMIKSEMISRKYKNGFYDSFCQYMKKQEMPQKILNEIGRFLDISPKWLSGDMDLLPDYEISDNGIHVKGYKIPSYQDEIILNDMLGYSGSGKRICADLLAISGNYELIQSLSDDQIGNMLFHVICFINANIDGVLFQES